MTKDDVILKLNEIWRCDIPFGWIPITGDEEIPNTEMYQADYFHHFVPNIQDVLNTVYGVTEVYELREDGTMRLEKISDCDFAYNGLEYIYTDKDFRFVIYYSHESSVTVGGKDLISTIHKIWPDSALHIWTTPFYE